MTDQLSLTTPDGRYIVVRGRLLRKANPALSDDERKRLVAELMAARRAVAAARMGSESAVLCGGEMAGLVKGAEQKSSGNPPSRRRAEHPRSSIGP
jgi:hypothetical protein